MQTSSLSTRLPSLLCQRVTGTLSPPQNEDSGRGSIVVQCSISCSIVSSHLDRQHSAGNSRRQRRTPKSESEDRRYSACFEQRCTAINLRFFFSIHLFVPTESSLLFVINHRHLQTSIKLPCQQKRALKATLCRRARALVVSGRLLLRRCRLRGRIRQRVSSLTSF